MHYIDYPKPLEDILRTLSEILRHDNQSEIIELIEKSEAHLDVVDSNDWDGGTYFWQLRLEVPVAIFVRIKPRLTEIENKILDELKYLNRRFTSNQINEVMISPTELPVQSQLPPSKNDISRLWPEGRFRLFISHVTNHKVEISGLKEELALRGVTAFVAHKDIKPSLLWQREIERALQSMHALTAIVTKEFHASLWTDQEIGWALGREILVVPVRLGADPYGFMGKFQGISGSLEHPDKLASSIVDALLHNTLTRGEMRRALAKSFSEATSNQMALALCRHITTVKEFTDEEKTEILNACDQNPHVHGASEVLDAIYSVFGRPTKPEPIAYDDVPF